MALPIEGHALTGRVEMTNWQQRVTTLIGDCPDAKGNRTSGVSLPWLLNNRKKCLVNDEEGTVAQ